MTTDHVVELERRAARLAAVAAVQQTIAATVALDEVYQEIYRAVSSLVDAPCFALVITNPLEENFVPEFVVADGQTLRAGDPGCFALGQDMIAEAMRTGRGAIGAMPVRWWAGTQFEINSGEAVASEITAPMIYGGNVLGVMQVLSYKPGAYDDEDLDLVCLLAQQAAVAIANARLFAAQKREQQRAETAAAIARIALECDGVRAAANAILQKLDDVVASEGKILGIVSPSTGTITCIAANGNCTPMMGNTAPLSLTAAAAAFERGKPTLVEDFRASAYLRDIAPASPIIMIPLMTRDRPIGLLGIAGSLAELQSDEYVETLLRLAPGVALAIDVQLLGEEEQRTQARERTLATALATMDQPVLILKLDGTVQYANAAALREYGYEAEEIVGLSLDTFIADSPTRSSGPAATGLLSDRGLWTGEHVHRRKDGTEFPVAVTLGHIRDDGGVQVGVVVSARNLTDERNIAEHLRRTEKLAAVGELVAGVAHELNNPLTGISTFAQLLLEEDLRDDQVESVGLIKREADRAIGVIRDLLLFARKTEPRDVPVDINTIVQHTIRLRAYASRSSRIEVHTILDPNHPHVRGDDQKLQQVLLNLLVNAEFAMQDVPVRHLSILTRLDNDRVVIVISDTGCGMSSETRQRVFEPFFTTKPAGVGTGLGLSVSYGILQAHHGTITVESTPGVGTTFTITLPASAAEATG